MMLPLSTAAHIEPQLFDDTPLFRSVNSEVQKEFSTDIDAPCLTWHSAFLIGKGQRETFKEDLDSIIFALVDALRGDVARCPSKPAITVYPRSDNRTIFFRNIVDDNGNLIADVEQTDKQKSVLNGVDRLVIVCFSREDQNELIDFSVRIRTTSNLFTITVLAKVPPSMVEGCLASREAFEALTRHFWEDRLVSCYLFRFDDLRLALGKPLLKLIFADVRGVALNGETVSFPTNSRFKTRYRDPAWAHDIVREAESLFSYDGEAHECTASYMLDGRALYLSALGPQTLDTQDRRAPSTFILCVHTHGVRNDKTRIVSEQQLGHLLDRLHLLETQWHAALLDLELLRSASAKLSQIDQSTEDARFAIKQFDGDDLANDRDVRQKLEAARQQLDDITNQFFQSSPAGVGLSFRIESARYYISQFQKNLAALRLGRVEGFRQYDHFVARRLGAPFEFIERIGIRYERATKVISEIHTTFATVQARKTGDFVADIQRYGELVLLGVLVPYYMMGGIEHLGKFTEELRGFAGILLLTIATVIFALVRFAGSNRSLQPTQRGAAAVNITAFGFLVSLGAATVIARHMKVEQWMAIVALAATGVALLTFLARSTFRHSNTTTTWNIIWGLVLVTALVYFFAIRGVHLG